MAKKFHSLAAPVLADAERRARVEQYERAIEIALALAKLREARGITQSTMVGRLGVSQPNVSRIEHEDDIYLSTLRNYIAALGGRLEVRAVFPDGDVVLLTGEASVQNAFERAT